MNQSSEQDQTLPGSEPAQQTSPSDGGLARLVTDCAPRLFAVVHVYPDTAPEITAWGMAFGDRYEVASVEGEFHGKVSSLDKALRMFSTDNDATAKLVWADHPTGTPQGEVVTT